MANANSKRREPVSVTIFCIKVLEIRKLEKELTDLRSGMRNLCEFHQRDHDYDRCVIAQTAKIQSAEKKLFQLKQGRLL